MSKNRKWKEKWKNGETLLGVHLIHPDGHYAEIFGNVGFDYLWICMEHGPLTRHDVRDILLGVRAADPRPAAFVRIPNLDPVAAKPILDMGADGIIFPMIRTADDARLAVAACRYPPDGIRGFDPREATCFGMDDTQEYIKKTSKEVLVMIQIETKEAYENLDEILKVQDIGAIIIGPMDFSGAYGHLTEYQHPDVMSKIDDVIVRTKAANIKVGVSIGAYDQEHIALWMNKGIDFMSVGAEPLFIIDGAKKALSNLKAGVSNRP